MTTILLYVAGVVVVVSALFAVILAAPDVVLNAGIGAALATAGGYVAVVNAFFPIGTLISVFVGVHLVTEGSIFAYKSIMWVLRKLPGIS